jgi:hypothetical protein
LEGTVLSLCSLAAAGSLFRCPSALVLNKIVLLMICRDVHSHNTNLLLPHFARQNRAFAMQPFTTSFSRLVRIALIAPYAGLALAQQLTGAHIPLSYPGLDSNCLEALNTSVSCPAFLSPLSVKCVSLRMCRRQNKAHTMAVAQS